MSKDNGVLFPLSLAPSQRKKSLIRVVFLAKMLSFWVVFGLVKGFPFLGKNICGSPSYDNIGPNLLIERTVTAVSTKQNLVKLEISNNKKLTI
jgi:hypothetical protein